VKTILILSLAIFSNIAFANDSTTIGCAELEVLSGSSLEDIDASLRAQTIEDIQQAYQVFCREKHNDGDAVYYANGQLATEQYNSEGSQLFYPNSAIMMEQNAEGENVWYYPTGELASENPDMIASLIFNYSERVTAKIEAPFKAQHAKCASGCSFVSWGIWGDEAHKHRRSCHNSGEAIDIHAITCGKTQSAALSKRFDTYVSCMRKKFKVLYRIKDHFGHAHIQIPNCKMIKLK
jgi:hypothetical protein